MKNLCLGQISSQEKSKQGKTSGTQLLGASSFFSTMDHQQRVYDICHKIHKNLKKNLGKINAIRKEFWIPKILSHRI